MQPTFQRDERRTLGGTNRNAMEETMVDARVTYTLQYSGRFYIIEHVPARVCQETGDEYFAPETVEHIQQMIEGNKKPDRVVETPVFKYA